MSVDYIVSSLPALQFDAPAPIEWEKFVEACGGEVPECGKWREMYLPTLLATKVASQYSYLDAYREYTVCVTTIMEGASI